MIVSTRLVYLTFYTICTDILGVITSLVSPINLLIVFWMIKQGYLD